MGQHLTFAVFAV